MKFLMYLSLFCGALLFSCSSNTGNEQDSMDEEADMVAEPEVVEEEPSEATAMASISAASESDVSGSVSFTQTGDSTVSVEIDLTGLTPGSHAMHIHQNGDCSAPDATSAGGHWNPTNVAHGKRGESDEFHKGDIMNLEVGDDGSFSSTVEISGWTIGGEDNSNIVGHAVIIHAGADDFTSQPSGAAGARVACGVIEATNM